MTVRSISANGLLKLVDATGTSRESSVRRLQAIANLLDTAFVIPGTKQRVGVDAIVGLVPGVGDVLTTLLSSYIIWEARNLGVSRFALARMLANLGVHATIGSLPLVGDLFDAFFRVNQRNMRILRAQLDSYPKADPTAYR